MATATFPSQPANGSLLPLKNRCAKSKSPYVRSHANNPTAWQLWSPETLALAKETNRLLFVSIGYSACHWCHVMAAESFMNDHVAQMLNESFIPVKIDREERPDVDKVYMDFLQATTGGGGWPLNVFVTPDLEPIFGGTYWPGPESERERGAGAGFVAILDKVATAWKEQEARCRESAAQITQQLRQFAQEGTLSGRKSVEGRTSDGEDELELELLEEAYDHYGGRFDTRFGGFGGAPKFPTPAHLSFLLRLAEWDGIVKDVVGEDEVARAREMATKTLEHMAKGGIKDQIGTGFARYSVTRDWSLPHFEKMLYDNAQLLPLYLDAYLITQSPLFLEMVHDIATYLTSEPIQSSTGGFHASEDADSAPNLHEHEHKEGAFYVWSASEFRKAIDDDHIAAMAAKYWDVREDGNVSPRYDIQGELEGLNTLCVTCTFADLAKEFNTSESSATTGIATARSRLLSWRDNSRPRPHLDDKIVVSWNGLAISGLARTAAALHASDPTAAQKYLASAISAATFIKSSLYNPSSHTLTRVYREGAGPTPGFADDYAFLISGLIDLYEATFNSTWLSFADDLQKTQIELFLDAKAGGFFGTAAHAPDILIRSKDAMDNAEPSTNGVTAQNLFRLAALLDDDAYAKLARKTVLAFEVEMGQHPGLFTGLMAGVAMTRLGVRPIVISGLGQEADDAVREVRGLVRPGSTVVRVSGDVGREEWLRGRNALVGSVKAEKDMVQVCEGRSCRIVKVGELAALLKGNESGKEAV